MRFMQCRRVLKGQYKTWTLESGLDCGLDSGLDNGLDWIDQNSCTQTANVTKLWRVVSSSVSSCFLACCGIIPRFPTGQSKVTCILLLVLHFKKGWSLVCADDNRSSNPSSRQSILTGVQLDFDDGSLPTNVCDLYKKQSMQVMDTQIRYRTHKNSAKVTFFEAH